MKKKNRGVWVLLIGVFLSFVAPTVLTHCNLSDWFDLSKDEYANIGSTIGGITAPIVGLAGAYLLYLTLMENKKANDLKNIHSNMDWVRDTISRNRLLVFDKSFEKLLEGDFNHENPNVDAIDQAKNYFDDIFQISYTLNLVVDEINIY